MHKNCFFKVSHLTSNKCNIHADFSYNHCIYPLFFINRHFFIFYFIYQYKWSFKVFKCSFCVVLFQIAISKQIANIDKKHWMFINNFVFYGFLCIFKFVNGRWQVPQHHNTLSIPRLDTNIVINTKFWVTWGQKIIVYFPPIIDFLDQVVDLRCSLE